MIYKHTTESGGHKNDDYIQTNSAVDTKESVEWYFGKSFVASSTASAKYEHKKTGKSIFKFWQDGTGCLTIKIN